jgi:acetyltransferase
VQQRYFGSIGLAQRTSHERLTRVCFNDYTRELAFVVEHADETKDAERRRILAVGRLSRVSQSNDAEIAFLVSDAMHHQGIGGELANLLVSAARAEGIANVYAYTMRDNLSMRRILERNGFAVQDSLEEGMITAKLGLG